MGGMCPAPTNIALLRHVRDGRVVLSLYSGDVIDTATGERVLDRAAELRHAGLVDVAWLAETLGSVPYVLTADGEDMLARHEEVSHA
jgi:hypothetical protein